MLMRVKVAQDSEAGFVPAPTTVEMMKSMGGCNDELGIAEAAVKQVAVSALLTNRSRASRIATSPL